MIWAIKQLLKPCNYLRIRQGDAFWESKRVYDIGLPAVMTAATILLARSLHVPIALHGSSTLLQSLSNLLALLIAFYMAALAAVATFERKGIDDTLRGGDALLRVINHDSGKHEDKKLTYRQFVAYLFGYLSFLSLILFLFLLFTNTAWPIIVRDSRDIWKWDCIIRYGIDPAIFAAFFFGLWQLFVTSLLGIYFLADRMQSLGDPHD